MKVLQIVLSLECGGLEKQVIHLSRALKERGDDVAICCLKERGELAAEAEQKGIPVIALKAGEGLSLSLIFKIYNMIRTHKFDIVHTHNFAPLIYGTLAARCAGVKAINTRHGRADRSTFPWIWALNDCVTAVSGDAKKELLNNNKIPDEKIRVVYNAVDIEDFGKTKVLRGELGLPDRGLILGIVARLSPEKDHATLFRAMESLSNNYRDLVLLVIGDGPLRTSLTELAQKLGIRDRVKFLGFRDDIPGLLSLVDVFVLSSLQEGISLTLLEAMSAQKAIVATRVGGNPEVVIDGETGFLVPPGDREKMASAIANFLSDPYLREKMGQAGLKRVREIFSLDKMVDSYQQIYEEVFKIKHTNRSSS